MYLASEQSGGSLSVIANAESTKMVTEAIQIGARAKRENKISVEEVQLCLEELDESINSQKQVENALESALYLGIEDEDIEEEFRKFELEMKTLKIQSLKLVLVMQQDPMNH